MLEKHVGGARHNPVTCDLCTLAEQRKRPSQCAVFCAMRGAVVTLCVLLLCRLSTGTRVTGMLTHEERDDSDNSVGLFYLSKFGVAAGHPLFVFGTVGFVDNFIHLRSRMVLVLLPQDTTNDLVSNYESKSCNDLMNSVLNESAYVNDSRCVSGFEDYVRLLPCHAPTACNQPTNIPVIGMSDFTYHVPSSPATQYYYLFMLACDRNYTVDCNWADTDKTRLDYDISLVNSDPDANNAPYQPFIYQFPYELWDILPLHMVFFIAYLALLTVHLLLHSGLCQKLCPKSEGPCKMHRLPALFTVSLFFEFIHVFLDLIHYSTYASNGVGAVWSEYLGEVANQVSDWLLILVLLLIGKGWMVTTSALRWKKLTFGIWGVYVFFFIVYFIWTVLQHQVFPLSIVTDHTFQSWPGGFYLTYRLLLLIYILYEMRQVYLVENRPEKLKLYFALAFLYVMWFCYLPLVVFIIAFINPLFKFRVVTGFVLTFDLLVNIGMVLLFAPRWARILFQFDSYLNELQEKRRYRGLKNFHYGSSESSTNVI